MLKFVDQVPYIGTTYQNIYLCTACNWKGKNVLKKNLGVSLRPFEDEATEPVIEFDPQCPRCYPRKLNPYDLNDMLNRYSEPDNPFIIKLGSTLGNVLSISLTERVNKIAEYAKEFVEKGKALQTFHDADYVKGIRNCIQTSIEKGTLKEEAKTEENKHMVYNTIKLLDELILQYEA